MTAVAEPAATARRRLGLTGRMLLVVAIAVVIAVVTAGFVSYPLVRGTAEAQARSNLSLLADLTAGALSPDGDGDRGPDRGERLPGTLAETLRREQVSGYVVGPASTPPAGVSPADIAAVTSGGIVSDVGSAGQGAVFVEGRAIAPGVGLVLTQPASVAADPTGNVVRRLAIALLIGLALALLVGVVAARRISRPIRQAADAAKRLARGDRDIAVEPRGPAEVAALADSINGLSAALAVSERRQREFLMSVSHELRTPLTAVRGYAEALADDVVPEEDIPRTGAIVRAEADRLDRLVSDLLALARLEAVDFQVTPVDVDLAEIGRQAAQVWGDRCAAEGVLFAAELPATALAARTDPVRVRQVIDNLAENALRVTPAGRPIVLAIRDDGWGAIIEVRDGGPGLTSDDRDVAFQPGALHDRYRGLRKVGTGLGLALVGRLAAGLGGTAEVGDAPEGGARFTVRLPISR